jgi:hypothetical protein
MHYVLRKWRHRHRHRRSLPISGQWILRNTNSSGSPDLSFPYGGSQFKPVVGDWNGDKIDSIGLVTW